MTKPRRHIPGQVALLTRRTAQRCYFLRPDEFIDEVTPYEIGKAVEEYGQQIYGAVVMSNHVHFAVGDTSAKRSDFMRNVLGGIARARNHQLKRTGHFWGAGSYGDMVLLDRDAMERKLLYIWLNPVRAGLVERAEDWPGFMILPRDWGEPIRIEKPGKYYGRRSPKSVEFTPQPPPGYEDMTLAEVKAHFQALLEAAEQELAALRAANDQQVWGAQAVKDLDPHSSPETEAPFRTLNPRFATKDRALMASVTAAYKDFLDCYETARQRWVGGKRGVTFPCGTLQLRRCAPVKCQPARDDEPGLFATA